MDALLFYCRQDIGASLSVCGFAEELAPNLEHRAKKLKNSFLEMKGQAAIIPAELEREFTALSTDFETIVSNKIRELFVAAKTMQFFSRNFCVFKWTYIGLNGCSMSIPLKDLCRYVGVDARDLAKTFGGSPARADDYTVLDSFACSSDKCVELAKILNKILAVRHSHGDGDTYLIYTVYPDGKVVKARESTTA
jgi:hypothetical protein